MPAPPTSPAARAAAATEVRVARVSLLLRQVDEEVKSRRYDTALEKVREVFQVDPKNPYARAYEERILAITAERAAKVATAPAPARPDETLETEKRAQEELLAKAEGERRLKEFQREQEIDAQKRRAQEQQERELEESARKASVNEAKQEVTTEIAQIELEALRRIEEMEKRLTAQLQSVAKSSSEPTASAVDHVKKEYEAQLQKLKHQFKSAEEEWKKIQEETFRKLKDDHKRKQDELTEQFERDRTASLQRAAEKERDRYLEAYRSAMMLLMRMNIARGDQNSILQSLRSSFNLSEQIHQEVERAVHVNTYIDVVRSAWGEGTPTEDDRNMLSILQDLYGISNEERSLIEQRVKQEIGALVRQDVVYVIDDDPSIRRYAEHILKKTFATVVTATNAEESVLSMGHTPPSVILSDINLGPSVMSGFTFFEKIRDGAYGDSLKNVPYVLMSAMEDDFFTRTATQMGVKAFLPKPFTREVLESTLRAALA